MGNLQRSLMSDKGYYNGFPPLSKAKRTMASGIKDPTAALTALRDFGSAAIAASKPVPVVPMFDPKVSGYILSNETTPNPTSGVKAEVNTELDWMIKVTPAPMAMATYPVKKENGLGMSVFNARFSAFAIVPFKMEFRIFTMPIRDMQSSANEIANTISPVLVSPSPVLWNKNIPVKFIVRVTSEPQRSRNIAWRSPPPRSSA